MDRVHGPIVKLESRPFPHIFRPLVWFSLASLHPSIRDSNRAEDVLQFAGSGWGSSKQESQEKAIVEAVERWAWTQSVTHRISDIGLEIDPTTNGFAAAPGHWPLEDLIRHSYFEALERWALSQFWEGQRIPFHEDHSVERKKPLRKLLKNKEEWIRIFRAEIQTQAWSVLPIETVFIYLVLIKLSDGKGVIPGSACGLRPDSTCLRANLEAFNHFRAFGKLTNGLLKPGPSITDQRLFYFASNSEAAQQVLSKLEGSSTKRRVDAPPVICGKLINGPWEPTVNVFRTVVQDSTPITEGGVDRFLI